MAMSKHLKNLIWVLNYITTRTIFKDYIKSYIFLWARCLRPSHIFFLLIDIDLQLCLCLLCGFTLTAVKLYWLLTPGHAHVMKIFQAQSWDNAKHNVLKMKLNILCMFSQGTRGRTIQRYLKLGLQWFRSIGGMQKNNKKTQIKSNNSKAFKFGSKKIIILAQREDKKSKKESFIKTPIFIFVS